MQSLGIAEYDAYRDYLEVEPVEINLLFNTILINVTSFFRDESTWDYVAKKTIPDILEQKKSFESIRIWSAGCASGEEAYTIAILFAEALGLEEMLKRVKIYGTDFDSEALATARQGLYPAKSIEHVPEALAKKYFDSRGDRVAINKDLRKALIFGRHDLVNDIPISQIDLLSCRNTLMYFNSETQAKVLTKLHFALAENGYLMLGKAEMLMIRTEDFEPDLRHRVFRKVGGRKREKVRLIAQMQGDDPGERNLAESQLRLTEVSFEQDPLAQLVVDADGILVLANTTARNLFNIPEKQVGLPFKDLEVSYRPVELHTLARQATATQRAIYIKDIELRVGPTELLYLDLHVAPLAHSTDGIIGVRFIFSDSTRLRNLQDELEERKQELETAYEELQSSNEELTTTNEELQSTVEELETTNEELQSTNEELETMNEELQSTNEELEHVNREIDTRSVEVSKLNHFQEAILNSLRGGVIVVNAEMKILVWNQRCEEMWGLRSDEVQGEHLMSLDIGLPLERVKPHLKSCLRECLEQPEFQVSATNRRGKAITVNIRCSPVCETDSTEAGALIFIDDHAGQG